MRKQGIGYYGRLLLLAVVLVSTSADSVMAAQSSSDSYKVIQTGFGPGTTRKSCSGQYCSKVSIGDWAVGTSESSGSAAKFSPLGGHPELQVIVEPGMADVGKLTTETTATKTMAVKIRTNLSSGYVLKIIGQPPAYQGHELLTPSTPTASSSGTEQFALNAVANTTPLIGAGPTYVPESQTFGIVANGYNQANKFQYQSGDVVAQSGSKPGQTNYTISMIVNIANTTPAGHYSSDFAAVVIPTF